MFDRKRSIWTDIKNRGLKMREGYDLFRLQHRKKTGKIKVGFLAQRPEIWNKSLKLYQTLKADSRFEAYLFCVQNGIFDGVREDSQNERNDTYEWFVSRGYTEAIDTYKGADCCVNFIAYPVPIPLAKFSQRTGARIKAAPQSFCYIK